MGFSEAFGATPVAAPTPSTGGFASAFGQGTSPTPTTNIASQRQADYVAPPVKPTLMGALGQGIKQTGSDFMSAVKGDVSGISDIWKTPAPTPVPVTPQSYLTDIYGTPSPAGPQGGIVGDTINAWTKAATQLQSGAGSNPASQ